jgi:hypothetical protein
VNGYRHPCASFNELPYNPRLQQALFFSRWKAQTKRTVEDKEHEQEAQGNFGKAFFRKRVQISKMKSASCSF